MHKLPADLAVIDLGSNTFHLLIVNQDATTAIGYREVYRLRKFVHLSEGGADVITEAASRRGLAAIKEIATVCRQYLVTEIVAVGTAMLRNSSNGLSFITQAEAESGIRISIISGVRESDLIYKGVLLAGLSSTSKGLILDIGGRSTELILIQGKLKIAAYSTQIGITDLRSRNQYSDPPTISDLSQIYKTLDEQLGHAVSAMNNHTIELLIGASGPFEILESILELPTDVRGNEIAVNAAKEISSRIISGSKKLRVGMYGMPRSRADYSLESMLIIDYILSKYTDITKIVVVPFTLKEGLINEKFRLA